MNISDEGVRLVCSFEGYHKALANGDCTAYRTYLGGGKYDIPTIGFGCTAGVKMGDVWSREKATTELKKELAKHEAFVTQYVTVPMTQNEFDALVSFSYNCGPANLKKLVKRLNRGDREATAKAFLLYVKAQGRTLPGLVSRRTREAALFQKPVEAPAEPYMPKTVQKAIEPPSRKTIATIAATAAGTASQFMPSLPEDPLGLAENVVNTGTRVKGLSEQGWSLYGWVAHGVPLSILAAVAGCVGLYWFICHFLPKRLGSNP